MTKYESRYKSLGFYAKGELKRFNNGIYTTEDKDEIAVLDGLTDATHVDEAEQSPQPKRQLNVQPPLNKTEV
ncbi:hypothetical protein [Lysinibacillus sp. TE18511]